MQSSHCNDLDFLPASCSVRASSCQSPSSWALHSMKVLALLLLYASHMINGLWLLWSVVVVYGVYSNVLMIVIVGAAVSQYEWD